MARGEALVAAGGSCHGLTLHRGGRRPSAVRLHPWRSFLPVEEATGVLRMVPGLEKPLGKEGLPFSPRVSASSSQV